jgi:DNA polymerase (family X)
MRLSFQMGMRNFEVAKVLREIGIFLDMEKLVGAAKDTGTILDVDSYPDSLDLRDEYIRKATEKGVRVGISSDSHSTVGFHFLGLGVAQARRGWASAANIANAHSADELLGMLTPIASVA